jgi:hypothetical protein
VPYRCAADPFDDERETPPVILAPGRASRVIVGRGSGAVKRLYQRWILKSQETAEGVIDADVDLELLGSIEA